MKDESYENGVQPREKFQAYHAVVGVFANVQSAEHALAAFHYAGFPHSDLSLVVKGTEAAEVIPSQAEVERASRGGGAGVASAGSWTGCWEPRPWRFRESAQPSLGWLGMILGGAMIGAAAGSVRWRSWGAAGGGPALCAAACPGEVLVLARL